jgi:ribosome-associated protein
VEIQQTGLMEGAIITTSIYNFVTMHREDHEEQLDLPPSKTKIKQQMHDLQDIGEQLVALGADQLKQLDLPERLHDAIREMKKINKFGAQRRQMQFIGRMMREVEIAPIIAKLEVWGGTSRQHIAYLHQVERWRDRLLENDAALTELLAAHPDADAQRLRALIRNAHKEKELNKPPKSYREIFQVLREILPQQDSTQANALE